MRMLDSGDVADHPYQTQFQAFFDALDAGKRHAAHQLRRRVRDAPRHRGGRQVRGRGPPGEASPTFPLSTTARAARTARASALAIAAHPDDIEFVMAGTLLPAARGRLGDSLPESLERQSGQH